MKELIVIQGAGQAEVEQLLNQVAQQLDPESSITSLGFFSTRRGDTFAVRPSRLCEGWDFFDLCLHLKATLADHSGITAQAWLQHKQYRLILSWCKWLKMCLVISPPFLSTFSVFRPIYFLSAFLSAFFTIHYKITT